MFCFSNTKLYLEIPNELKILIFYYLSLKNKIINKLRVKYKYIDANSVKRIKIIIFSFAKTIYFNYLIYKYRVINMYKNACKLLMFILFSDFKRKKKIIQM